MFKLAPPDRSFKRTQGAALLLSECRPAAGQLSLFGGVDALAMSERTTHEHILAEAK
jgi:hypothetical protein